MADVQDSIILLLEVTNYILAAVYGAIVDDDEFKIAERLGQNASYCPRQKSIMSPAICRHYDAHQGLLDKPLWLDYSLVFQKVSKTQGTTSLAVNIPITGTQGCY
jgi:hypothetical protein